jgi:hypothetical protein
MDLASEFAIPDAVPADPLLRNRLNQVRAPALRILAASLLMALLALGPAAGMAAADSWSFAVLGDQQSLSSTGVNTPITTAMALQIATQNPAFILCGGDNILGVALPGLSLAQQYTNWKTAMAPSSASGATAASKPPDVCGSKRSA